MLLRELKSDKFVGDWGFTDLDVSRGRIVVWSNTVKRLYDIAFYLTGTGANTGVWIDLDELEAQCVLNYLLAGENNLEEPVA